MTICNLRYLIYSLNLYTGEVITGIDDALRARLREIIQNMKFATGDSVKAKKSRSKQEEYSEEFPNAWGAWTKSEEKRLAEAFKQGASLEELAQSHGRMVGGIKARLKKLGLIE